MYVAWPARSTRTASDLDGGMNHTEVRGNGGIRISGVYRQLTYVRRTKPCTIFLDIGTNDLRDPEKHSVQLAREIIVAARTVGEIPMVRRIKLKVHAEGTSGDKCFRRLYVEFQPRNFMLFCIIIKIIMPCTNTSHSLRVARERATYFWDTATMSRNFEALSRLTAFSRSMAG